MSQLEVLQLCAIVVIAAIASYFDVTTRRLPNWLSLAAFVVGLGVAFTDTGWQGVSSHAIHAAAALVVGMVLFRIGAIGAGDAKFYAGLAAWFPWSAAPYLALAVALGGLALLVVWFSLRRLIARSRPAKDEGLFAKLPFGVAIGLGAALLQAAVVLSRP